MFAACDVNNEKCVLQSSWLIYAGQDGGRVFVHSTSTSADAERLQIAAKEKDEWYVRCDAIRRDGSYLIDRFWLTRASSGSN